MSADDKDAELRELRERLARLEGDASTKQPPPPPIPPSPPAKQNGCGAILGAAVVIAIGFGLVSMCTGSSGTSGGVLPSTVQWTPPAGYYVEPGGSGPAVATKWAQPTRAECRGSGGVCFALDAIAERGCPRNLYVSITLLDSNGQNIGWTNDTAQGVLPGEQTRLVFTTYERGAKSSRIAEVSCY